MNLIKADEIYKQKVEENPNFDHDMVMMFRDEMPEEFSAVMHLCAYGCHIVDSDMYEKAVRLLENKDGTEGAHWTIETIRAKSGIDFDSKDYTLYDYAYIVNMLYSDFSNIFSDSSYYIKMAKNYLEDEDYYGEANERAYCDARKRIKYYKTEE